MKRAVLVLALTTAPALARDPIGAFGRWAAFRDAAPVHCFAISEPVEQVRGAQGRAFLSIARWPAAGIRGQLHVRLSRPRDPRAAVMLAVGERRFPLTAGPLDAWAPDTAGDRAIIAALRANRSLSVESIGADRRPIADVYALNGAATAIDAAMLACAR